MKTEISPLMKRLKKASTLEYTTPLSESTFFNQAEVFPTQLPIMNLALSGSLAGGLTVGLTMLSGESKSFKSLMSLILAKSYMDKYPESAFIFFDSEFGIPKSYFEMLDIPMERVLHIPIKNVEELKFEAVNYLENVIGKDDKVVIVIDSIGNLASKREVENSLNEKSVEDMTRAKQLKSLFRMVTPYLTLKNIPMIAVNHIYQSQCLAGDVLIKTSNGNKAIKDIKIGDMVYALNGLQKVIAAYKPEDLSSNGKKFLEMTFDDGSTVKCTHDHKFLMSHSNWSNAIDIKIGEEFF